MFDINCPSHLGMSLPSFVEIIRKTDWEKSNENVIFSFKMAAISQKFEQLGPNIALHSRSAQDMCLQIIIGISAKLRALGSKQRFENTCWILCRRRFQTNQTQSSKWPWAFIPYLSDLCGPGCLETACRYRIGSTFGSQHIH